MVSTLGRWESGNGLMILTPSTRPRNLLSKGKANMANKQKAIEDHIEAWRKAGWPYTKEELKELERIYGVKAPKSAWEAAKEEAP